MKKACYILAAGSYFDDEIKPSEEDFVIAADAGFAQAERLGIRVDLALGDMDSMGRTPDFENTVVLPAEKDDTDTLVAIRTGLEKGYRKFHIYGGLGGERIEHSLANIQCIVFLSKQGAKGFLYGKNSVITAVTDGEIRCPAETNGYVPGLSADGPACGVCIEGLKDTLNGAEIRADFPVGVSNEFLPGKESRISVERGTLIIVYPK